MNRKRGMCVCVVVLGLLAPSLARGAGLIPPIAKIKTDRPRLLLRPKASPYAISLAQIKAIPRDADFNKALARLRRQRSAAAQAMVWLLTGDNAAADKAVARMLKYDNPKGKGDAFTVYFRLREFGLAYDWLHTHKGFTRAMKAEVRKKLAPLAATGMRISNDHIFHNYVWMSAGGVGLWALATAGEDADANRLYGRIRKRLNERLYPGWKYLDGQPGESMGYWALYDLSPGALALLAAQSASETDLMSIVKKDGDWLDRQYQCLIHATRPNMQYLPWGDSRKGAPDNGVTHEMAGVSDALAWALKSPTGAYFSKWMAKSRRGMKRFYGETAMFYILYTRHLRARPKTPPLSYLAGGKDGGHFIARSHWGPDATIVGFRCTDHFGSHNHFDQGSFVIHRKGLLAVDPPVYPRVGGPQQPTNVHNTLLIDGRQQRPVRGQWFKTVEAFKQNLKGGRRLETGDILFHKEAGRWAAVAGQFAQAYPAGVVKSCVRQLLFVRPGKVVVVDQVTPPAGRRALKVQWLLQVHKTPKIRLGDVVTTNGKSWLRCRPIFPGRSIPTVTPTPVKTHRVAYNYEARHNLVLVHLLEVGDGRGPGEAAPVEARRTIQGLEVTFDGKTFLFANREPFAVSAK